MLDCVVIGAGVCGTSTARFLSRYKGNFLVLEKTEDVCSGTTKANSGIVHGGYDAETGSKMAYYNLLGYQNMQSLSEELGFGYINNGSLVLCFSEEDRPKLESLKKRGETNGVKDLRIIEREEILSLEPNISDKVVCAMLCKNSGIVDPFVLTFAMAENACSNGVKFKFNSEVIAINKIAEGYEIVTPNEKIHTKTVVNAAGLYSSDIHNMVSSEKLKIIPRRGSYYLLDKINKGFVSHTLFQLPTKFGKGVLVTPTVDGNILVGPDAKDMISKESVDTESCDLEYIKNSAMNSVKNLPLRDVITSFAGLRAHLEQHDFIVGEVKDAKGFFDEVGIESPGLTSGPIIGKEVSDMVRDYLNLEDNPNYNPIRKPIPSVYDMSYEKVAELIEKDARYSKIICRCEKITEGEIVEALHREPKAVSLDGLKRRVRAGAGRCQGGFCTPDLVEIISRELNIPIEEVKKNYGNSEIVISKTKENI